MSPHSAMTSPRLMPMAEPDSPFVGHLRLTIIILRWISAAQRIAPTTLGNSTSKPSPVVNDVAVVLLDLGIDQLTANPLQAFVRTMLVHTH
jgi:hypothetical protein